MHPTVTQQDPGKAALKADTPAATHSSAPSTPAAKHAAKKQAVSTTISASVPGKPKSGRVWKTKQTQRASARVNVKSIKQGWKKMQELRLEKQIVKEHEKEIKQQQAEELEAKKQQRIEREKRRLENERKGEVVQRISDPAKIKRMSRKQLRTVKTA